VVAVNGVVDWCGCRLPWLSQSHAVKDVGGRGILRLGMALHEVIIAQIPAQRPVTSRLVVLHLVAAVVCFVFFFVVPILACLVLLVEGDDPGGPLFLPILIIGIVAGAAVITVILAVAVLATDIIERRTGRISWWPAVLVFLSGAAMGGLAGGVTNVVILVAAGGIAMVAYFIHWMAISFLSRLFLNRKRVHCGDA
jgi:hypothetical protein